jgi:uncharacterized membrane protein YcaP (DUF421 family)
MDIDWQTLFVPQTPLVEIVIRGTVIYLVLLAALRVLVRRHIGSLSLMDLLLIVLIADAAQNAMADEYHSITEGLVLCAVLIGWNYLLDWLSFRYETIEKLLEPRPLPVVRNGRMQRRNMRMELLTDDELMSQLRQQGIEKLESVKLAYIEPDGAVSVVRRDGKNTHSNVNRDKKRAGI